MTAAGCASSGIQHFDLLVVGSGPAGQKAAITAAAMGRSVGIIERKPRIGGACLQTGTIPSKALREIAYMASRSGSRGMRAGVSGPVDLGHGFLAEAVRKKNMVIAEQESVILNQLLLNGVHLIPGEASFEAPNRLGIRSLRGETGQVEADVIVLASGSRPRRPDSVPFDKNRVLDSTSILNLKRMPASLVIVGGGVIACEFATFFAALGVQVTIVDSHRQLLSFLSVDIVSTLSDAMSAMGVELYMQSHVQAIVREDGFVTTRMQSGEVLHSECVLYAMGRVPNLESLMISRAGIDADEHGWITVNQSFQTSVPHIYAVGDLIGRPALASTGMEQGRIAVNHGLGVKGAKHSPHLPMAIYTIPELSCVGKTEKELQQDAVDYVVGRALFRENARGQIIGDQAGLLKIIADRRSHAVLGVHIVGESASELLHIGQMVMSLNGTVDDVAGNVFNYPTLSHLYQVAAFDCLEQIAGVAH